MSDSSQGGPTPPQNPYGGQTPGGTPGQTPEGQPPAGNPYGQPPAGNPYGGQAPYAEQSPPAYAQGSPQPGQQPGQPAPYGSPYSQPAQTGPLGDGLDMYGRPLRNDKRPGTVTAAGWTTLAFAGLTALLFGFLTLAMVVAKDEVLQEIDRAIADQGATSDFNAEDAFGIVLVVLVVLTAWCVIACLLAVFAMRRSNVSRILLVISACVSAVLSLLAIGSVISGVWLLASIAVVVLLFTGGAGDWFARRTRY